MFQHNLLKLRAFLKGTRIHRTSIFVFPQKIDIGENCQIGPFCTLGGGEAHDATLTISSRVIVRENTHIRAQVDPIEIGEDTMVGNGVWIGGRGKITIERNCLIGMHVVIVSSNHDYKEIATPYHNGQEPSNPVVIEANTWIASNSVILPGVRIGTGSVIGAGSVVTRNIPPNTIAIGNPAMVIKKIVRK